MEEYIVINKAAFEKWMTEDMCGLTDAYQRGVKDTLIELIEQSKPLQSVLELILKSKSDFDEYTGSFKY